MRRKFLLNSVFCIILLVGCKDHTEYRDTFNAQAKITVSDVIFKAEITESYIEFTSEYLTEPVKFQNDQLSIDDIQGEILPKGNSAFRLSGLILEVLNSGINNGYYENIPYLCEFNKDTKFPEEIRWGDILVEFNYFE